MNAEQTREKLHHLLGDFPAATFTLQSRQPITAAGFRAEELQFQTSSGETIRAFLTGPDRPWHRCPAILYIHAHGNRYDIGAAELLTGRPALHTPAYAGVLAQENCIALCIDLPCFGARHTQTESIAAKRHLLNGKTLFGAMIADLTGVLNVMTAMPEIDSARIGVLGISMGATLGFWLAALDRRIKATAHLCCFADLQTLAETEAIDLHGIYMAVPGLFDIIRTGEIAGLIAPRPQLACIGLADPLTPATAVERAIADVRAAYGIAGAADRLAIMQSPDPGHRETPAMREAVLAFFRTHLFAADNNVSS